MTPPEIVPRWEWRTFGERFAQVERVLGALAPERVHDSDEVYFLSPPSNAPVKVRDGLMDVKHLVNVNDDGLQLWRPVMKAPFPVAAADAATVFTTLEVGIPPLERAEYTLDELVELVSRNAELLVVPVTKHRAHYIVDECMVELTDVAAGQRSTRTIAIESPDPALVVATIRTLGLDDRPNVAIAPGLKALLGFGARRYAVLDVGTNSVKFHLGERRADGTRSTIVDRAAITRLGEGLEESGVLSEEAMRRTVAAMADMVEEARRDGAVDIAAVGTAGLRSAPNRQVFVDAVQAQVGVLVEVISGEEEARLAYLAATSALPQIGGPLLVFDSGGGSTQFTFGQDGHVDEQFSVDVGAVRVSERHGLAAAVSKEALAAALDAVRTDLERLDARPRPDAIVAIGGTATNLAAVKHGLEKYDPEVVQGTVLDAAEIDRQMELYRTRDAAERRTIVGLQPARAEVILAGACILRTILTTLQHESLTVSDRGLRHGVVIERFAG